MSGTTLLINLAGSIALLLWGTHMISSALLRGFGTPLRQWLGHNLNNRWMALLSGIGITGVLQSSTAVSLMATSFTAAGALGLAPALAVMLGANIGSTLVVQLLSADVSMLTPIVLLAGLIVFRLRDDSRYESVGSALIGLGLMLLALHMLGSTLAEVEGTPIFQLIMQSLDGDLLIALLVALILTWLCHSSVAVVLLIISLAATGMLSASTIVALVLGVNIGGALPSVINAGSSVGRRLPLGNLLVRTVGALAVLPFAGLLAQVPLAPSTLVVCLHTGFNLLLGLVFIGLTDVLANALTRWLPAPKRDVDPGMPHYLDEAGLEVANIGLSNAAREALRMADMLSAMLGRMLQLLHTSLPACADEVRRIDQSLDLLSAAIRAYLADIGKEGISDSDADRSQEILTFVINLEHAADILSSSLAQLAMRRLRRDEQFSAFELGNIAPLHDAVLESLSLAITVFLREDIATAHQLIQRKETVRRLEAEASREHFRQLQEDKSTWAESGDIFQRVLRDYRRVHHHIAALAYPLLERAGERSIENIDQAKENPSCVC
ncbi:MULTISPECIES: Na/Pi cotransporter family protein [Gammaproteobacteria]|uniref:Na/Pi cotransporter family protein n=1 Tax=Gammaproteobacteria TaxID=1236 RepID=UPI001913956E|nr:MULTISPECIES: Na/Pi cotransporter family protein [Gammaproteobacteria]MBK5302066.1 Na/Pi cotransporter family protein [Bacillus sp. TH86]MBK5321835.1 Na/Pi cotransporter family protein [Bacillus sp. TH59]MBK5336785.1 Na/Pi cotransporter family protein [Bacillus sp. TH57]MBK5310848.1 Na/Pi cotransporter family protein [Pseudomonas sp. TH71]MBK5316332.1 Na/Pi cotransporter family protein [Erwinia sp. TH79]